ncbi:MAG: MucR family transcriptional regulator [Sphingomonas sp.]
MSDDTTLITLTADIVSAHVGNNSVAVGDVAATIRNVYGALAALHAPQAEPQPEKPRGVVSVRASIKPGHLVSMIDGKPYKMLKRHISLNGYTPATYRETFGLPRDYPMVAAEYAEKRRAIAVKIGLGQKSKAPPTPAKAKLRIRTPKTDAITES